MKRPVMHLAFASALLAFAALAAGCGGGYSSSGGSGTATSASPGGYGYGGGSRAATTTQATSGNTTITVKSTSAGRILVDGSGMTVYLFEKDKGSTSTCTGSCAQYWPPVTTSGAPKAGSGAMSANLGTTKRSDGKTEVTYSGHPLYYYAGDKKPGDVTGQGLNAFGALWYVLSPAGKAITS